LLHYVAGVHLKVEMSGKLSCVLGAIGKPLMIGMLCSFDIEFLIIFVIGSSTKLQKLVLKGESNWVWVHTWTNMSKCKVTWLTWI
jgi:hypothetical protein